MGQKRVDFRSLWQNYREVQIHELQRLGGLATAAGKVIPDQRSAFGKRSMGRFARQRKDLALRRMPLQGDDAADLTAMGDVSSVQGFKFAESKQAMRRARLELDSSCLFRTTTSSRWCPK